MRPEHLDGSTRLYGILGDPISTVRSPEVFNAMFSRRAVNAVLVPLHVGEENIESAWVGLTKLCNLSGLVVTMPHKASVVALLDEVGPAGRFVGAVNAARREPDGRWTGDMFDGAGFVEGLRNQGHEPAGWRVRLLGLGGAGAAIASALAEAAVASLSLHDPDVKKRDTLCDRLQVAFPNLRISAESSPGEAFDAVVNATPLGMKSTDPLPFDPAALPAKTLVVDIVTKPEITPLLRRAIDTGHRVHSGKHMHLGQARRVAQFFGYELI